MPRAWPGFAPGPARLAAIQQAQLALRAELGPRPFALVTVHFAPGGVPTPPGPPFPEAMSPVPMACVGSGPCTLLLAWLLVRAERLQTWGVGPAVPPPPSPSDPGPWGGHRQGARGVLGGVDSTNLMFRTHKAHLGIVVMSSQCAGPARLAPAWLRVPVPTHCGAGVAVLGGWGWFCESRARGRRGQPGRRWAGARPLPPQAGGLAPAASVGRARQQTPRRGPASDGRGRAPVACTPDDDWILRSRADGHREQQASALCGQGRRLGRGAGVRPPNAKPQSGPRPAAPPAAAPLPAVGPRRPECFKDNVKFQLAHTIM